MDGSKLFIGRADSADVDFDPRYLAKHIAVLGSSGSGKTYLSKVMIEEAIRFKIPVIAIDTQGDIASLNIPSDSVEIPWQISADYWKNIDLKVWTPGSEFGLPLSMQPNLKLDSYARVEDRVRAILSMGRELAGIIGQNDDATAAGFSTIIEYADKYQLAIDSLDDICAFLEDPPKELADELEPIFNDRRRQKALESLRIKRLSRKLLLEMGMPIDISTLFGYEEGGAWDQGKTRISVISLLGLDSDEDRQLFIAALARSLHAYMLKNPRSYPNGMLFIDECNRFIPAVRKPVCKDPLMLLLRQGRKFGISVMLATQSPGDIDYIAMSMTNTRFVGRFATLQEAHKVAPAFQECKDGDRMLDKLPNLKAGQFIMICPDAYDEPIIIKSRQLASKHVTQTLEEMSQYVSDEDRQIYT